MFAFCSKYRVFIDKMVVVSLGETYLIGIEGMEVKISETGLGSASSSSGFMAHGHVPVGLEKRPATWVQEFVLMGPRGREAELQELLVYHANLRYEI